MALVAEVEPRSGKFAALAPVVLGVVLMAVHTTRSRNVRRQCEIEIHRLVRRAAQTARGRGLEGPLEMNCGVPGKQLLRLAHCGFLLFLGLAPAATAATRHGCNCFY
jgi:hypothetical protein